MLSLFFPSLNTLKQRWKDNPLQSLKQGFSSLDSFLDNLGIDTGSHAIDPWLSRLDWCVCMRQQIVSNSKMRRLILKRKAPNCTLPVSTVRFKVVFSAS